MDPFNASLLIFCDVKCSKFGPVLWHAHSIERSGSFWALKSKLVRSRVGKCHRSPIAKIFHFWMLQELQGDRISKTAEASVVVGIEQPTKLKIRRHETDLGKQLRQLRHVDFIEFANENTHGLVATFQNCELIHKGWEVVGIAVAEADMPSAIIVL